MLAVAIFALAGLLGVWATLRLALATRRIRRADTAREQLLAEGVQAAGTVVDVREFRDADGLARALPVVRFVTIAGEEVTASPAETWPARFVPGETLVVTYDPASPSRFTPSRERPGTRASFTAAMAVLLGTLTVGALFFTVRLFAVARGHSFDLPGIDIPGVVLPSNRPR